MQVNLKLFTNFLVQNISEILYWQHLVGCSQHPDVDISQSTFSYCLLMIESFSDIFRNKKGRLMRTIFNLFFMI